MAEPDPKADGPGSSSAGKDQYSGYGTGWLPGTMPPGVVPPPWLMGFMGPPTMPPTGHAPPGASPGGPWPGEFMTPHYSPAVALAVASVQAADAMMHLLEARAGLWRRLFGSISQAAAAAAHAGQTGWDRTPHYADSSGTDARGARAAKADDEISPEQLEPHLQGLSKLQREQVLWALRMMQEMSRRARVPPHPHPPQTPDTDYDW